VGRQQARGLVAVLHAQAMARLVEVRVDGVLGDAEPAADLLGAQVVMDQPQALPLSRGEQLDRLAGRLLGLAHRRKVNELNPAKSRLR
jgi:hypothetical protein